jgi:hypothetical protein
MLPDALRPKGDNIKGLCPHLGLSLNNTMRVFMMRRLGKIEE